MPLLRPPPYAIRRAVYLTSSLAILACVGFGALMGYYVATVLPKEAASLVREKDVWERGVPAEDATYEGNVSTNRFVFHSYKLKVTYADSAGTDHEQLLEFSTLGGSLDTDAPSEVRFDPAHPESAALGAAVAIGGARWASIAFFGIVGIAIIVGAGALVRLAVINLGLTRRCAFDGVPVEVELTVPPQTDQNGNTTYVFRPLGETDRRATHRTTFGKKHGPIYVGGDTTRALALRSAGHPSVVVLLRSDLHPFVFPAEEAAEIAEAANARRGLDAAVYR